MKPNPTNRSLPLLWGHRGAMDDAPQNTLPAFLAAVDQGADGVELDVQLTKDGTLVVFHDARVDALTDGRGALADLTWGQVRRLDAGRHHGRAWTGTRIPTLDEVLTALPPHFLVNVELKTALSEESRWDQWVATLRGSRPVSPEQSARSLAESGPLVEAVARELGSADPHRFWLSSFDPYALRAAYEWLPRIPQGFLHSPAQKWNTLPLVASLPYRACHPHFRQVTAAAVAQENAAGRRVHVWTVNDAGVARAMAAAGVDALITNRPEALRRALEQR